MHHARTTLAKRVTVQTAGVCGGQSMVARRAAECGASVPGVREHGICIELYCCTQPVRDAGFSLRGPANHQGGTHEGALRRGSIRFDAVDYRLWPATGGGFYRGAAAERCCYSSDQQHQLAAERVRGARGPANLRWSGEWKQHAASTRRECSVGFGRNPRGLDGEQHATHVVARRRLAERDVRVARALIAGCSPESRKLG